MSGLIIALAIVLAFGGGLWGVIWWFDVFNSPDGERYRRIRMQGPFVPLSEEDIAQDEERRAKRSSPD